jgi:hypothetical protein
MRHRFQLPKDGISELQEVVKLQPIGLRGNDAYGWVTGDAGDGVPIPAVGG